MAHGGKAGEPGTPGNSNDGGVGGEGGIGIGGDVNFKGGKGGNGGIADEISTPYTNGNAHNELPSPGGAGGGSATQIGDGGDGGDGVDSLGVVPVSINEQGLPGSGGGSIQGKGGVAKVDELEGALGGNMYGDTEYRIQTKLLASPGIFDQRFISGSFYPSLLLVGGEGGLRVISGSHRAGDGGDGAMFCGGGSGASGSHESTGQGSTSGNGGLAAGGAGASGYENHYTYSPALPSKPGFGGNGLIIVEW
jgi:hypothetical protein